jgi:hypothetical protein
VCPDFLHLLKILVLFSELLTRWSINFPNVSRRGEIFLNIFPIFKALQIFEVLNPVLYLLESFLSIFVTDLKEEILLHDLRTSVLFLSYFFMFCCLTRWVAQASSNRRFLIGFLSLIIKSFLPDLFLDRSLCFIHQFLFLLRLSKSALIDLKIMNSGILSYFNLFISLDL